MEGDNAFPHSGNVDLHFERWAHPNFRSSLAESSVQRVSAGRITWMVKASSCDTIRPACLSVLIPFVSPTSGGRMPNEQEEVCASLEYSKVTDIRREVTDRRGKRRRLTPPPPPPLAVEEVKKSNRDVSCPRRHLPRHAFCGPELTTRLDARWWMSSSDMYSIRPGVAVAGAINSSFGERHEGQPWHLDCMSWSLGDQ